LDSVDINSAFLNALEYSDIPGEDWGMFLLKWKVLDARIATMEDAGGM
jgi:hypothetical protein